MKTAAVQKDERYDIETHYGFGQNWADYAAHIGEEHIRQAEEGLFKLIPAEDLKDKTLLDIGCGSGLHSLAALRAGVKHLTALDFDPNSVRTTKNLLAYYWEEKNYKTFQHNILIEEPHPELKEKSFDIVYSWGVLHHTGDMALAIRNAAHLVAPGGLFVIALYKKTPLCGFWTVEKKFYSGLTGWARKPLDYLYAGMLLGAKVLLGQNPVAFVRDYRLQRGMRFMNDIPDWMGGYPYESASPAEVKEAIEALGFTQERSYNKAEPKGLGLFGSSCAEYVFRKS